jgi:hypothetical protein
MGEAPGRSQLVRRESPELPNSFNKNKKVLPCFSQQKPELLTSGPSAHPQVTLTLLVTLK